MPLTITFKDYELFIMISFILIWCGYLHFKIYKLQQTGKKK